MTSVSLIFREESSLPDASMRGVAALLLRDVLACLAGLLLRLVGAGVGAGDDATGGDG